MRMQKSHLTIQPKSSWVRKAGYFGSLSLVALAFVGISQAMSPKLTEVKAAEGMPDITGQWTFQTSPYGLDCSMKGGMTIAPTKVEGVFSCSLLAEETCNGETWQARQSCVVMRRDDGVYVQSRVEAVAGNPGNYMPDNFLLPVITSDKMTGELRSASIAPVVFKRADGAIS